MAKIEINLMEADIYDTEVLNLLREGGIERLVSQYKVISRKLDDAKQKERKLNDDIAKLERESVSYKAACEMLENDKKYLEEFVKHLDSPDNVSQCCMTDDVCRQMGDLALENSELKNKIAELEDRHQSDCINMNQLQTTIDTLVDKLAALRKIKGAL